LAWTSDGKKLISGPCDLILILDTATWKQIATLDGQTQLTSRPPLQYDHWLQCAALSADGQVLVTDGYNQDVHAWNIRAILKKTGLEDLLPIPHVNLTTLQ
jgi:WD40 repeat protein